MSKLEILLLILAIFGGIDLAARGWTWLSSIFPRLLSVQSRICRFLADLVAVPVLRQRAIATKVEEVLNQTAFGLQKHLPKGWVRRARIRWIRHQRTAQFKQGELLLRIRPDGDPDLNLIRSLTVYFESALFPDTRDLIPQSTLSAISLAITRGSIEETHPYLLGEFDARFVNAASTAADKLRAQIGDCIRLNEFGLLMGPFVREVDAAVNRCRFHVDRDSISDQIRAISEHMLGFQPLLRLKKPDEEWFFRGPYTSYGFLLVSRPPQPARRLWPRPLDDEQGVPGRLRGHRACPGGGPNRLRCCCAH